MKPRNVCGFTAGSMKVFVGALIPSALLVVMSAFAAAQTIPQNTTGRNPGTQVPPGAAVPEATTAASQTTPDKRIQGGVGGVSSDSFKFGEYNGLENSGPFGIGNLDLRGGAAYDSKDTWRWRLQGSNLGLENRNLILDFGKQGKFQLRLVYNEILANRSDTFHAPYLAGVNRLIPTNRRRNEARRKWLSRTELISSSFGKDDKSLAPQRGLAEISYLKTFRCCATTAVRESADAKPAGEPMRAAPILSALQFSAVPRGSIPL